ncbi:MAG: hypothetical protein HC847_28140 [Hydrococcus sp. RU_2_2]|nr:hypothetical protein [Hydrococcus sp. RU_2_2]NJP19780.1 hypothetical protein [Hydrococcus sp. CRU_1_1]
MIRNYHVPFWRAVEGATSSLTLIAMSKYILCAVNPTGTCSDCQHYKCHEDIKVGEPNKSEFLKYLSQFPKGYSEEEVFALAAYAAIIRHAIARSRNTSLI